MTLLRLSFPVTYKTPEALPEVLPTATAIVEPPIDINVCGGFADAIRLLQRLATKAILDGEFYAYHRLDSAMDYLKEEQERLSNEYFAEENWQ